METRRLGSTEISLTVLGFGAAPIGNLFHAVDDDSANAALYAAWDGGVRYFDTAPHYCLGLSERRLGRALADRPRQDFVVSTKVGRVEVPGVVGVAATGNLQKKSFYSSYGISTVDVAAPGGDSILQRTAAAVNGRVLSTWPASLINTTCLPARRVFEGTATYCYQQGTSMASPHVAGVAALLESVSGKTGGALSAALQQATNALTCPTDTSDYDFFPAVDGGAPQTCQGGAGHNSWFGSGEVDALKAVQ